MQTIHAIKTELEKAFRPKQASTLAKVIIDTHSELVKADDFNELKGIVKELAESQKETQNELKELAKEVKELSIEVKGLSVEVKELSIEVKGLSVEVKGLAKGLKETNSHIGGIDKTSAYAFENEAYRMLPPFLKKKYGIEMKEKMVRAEIGDKEINIFGRGMQDGREVLIVGEAKLRIEEKREAKKIANIFKELEDKVIAVREEYKDIEAVKILITHYTTKAFLSKAKEKGIIVVQSFEWD